MSKIQIICSKPGLRRNGKEHPASAIYDAGHWTEAQLDAFRADQLFVVQTVGAGGVELSGTDFDAAVAAKVEEAKTALQDTFNTTVANAVAEKLAMAKAEHDNAIDAAGKKLAAAEARVKELEAAAKKDAASIADLAKKLAAAEAKLAK